MGVSLPVASKPATGDDGAVSSTTCWIVLLCFVLFSVANIIVTYVCALLKPPTRGVCDSYCNCTPIVVNKICLKQMTLDLTTTYKYLGVMINDKTNLKDQIAQLEIKLEAAYQTILAIAGDRQFWNTQMETIWKRVTTCLIPIITYGGETTWNLPKQRTKN